MFREIIIFGLVCFLHAKELQEGSPCMRDGVRGVCRKSKVCPSVALHIQDSGVACNNNKGDDPVVCCTDCHINDVSNAAVTMDGLVWKTGGTRKSYDKCIEYASTLPYECKTTGTRHAVSKVYDAAGSCHRLQVTVNEGHSTTTVKQRVEYPYLVLLGYNTPSLALESAEWKCQGFIISERFIITTGHCGLTLHNEIMKYVATSIEVRPEMGYMGVDSSWHIYDVKRVIQHPHYSRSRKDSDIGLVETEKAIQFGPTVLPICLYDRPWDADTAWTDMLAVRGFTEPRKVSLRKLSEEECSIQYQMITSIAPSALNYTTMVCFDVDEHKESCFGSSGRPLYVTGDLKCMKYVTALTSFGAECGKTNLSTVFITIDPFLPWIEKEVWPEPLPTKNLINPDVIYFRDLP